MTFAPNTEVLQSYSMLNKKLVKSSGQASVQYNPAQNMHPQMVRGKSNLEVKIKFVEKNQQKFQKHFDLKKFLSKRESSDENTKSITRRINIDNGNTDGIFNSGTQTIVNPLNVSESQEMFMNSLPLYEKQPGEPTSVDDNPLIDEQIFDEQLYNTNNLQQILEDTHMEHRVTQISNKKASKSQKIYIL